jgi:hypothetical protein
MKWLLIVMAINGSISSAEFETENACLTAVIALNLKAARHILNTEKYQAHIDAFCSPKG